MLVLTRRKGQSIIIGDNIEVSVEDVSGDAVRLGISAPREIPVFRREVYEAIREENLSASRPAVEITRSLKKLAAPPPGEEERQ